MKPSVAGLFAGLLLALTAAVGGLGWMLVALLLGALGFLVGAQLEGRIDLTGLVPGRRRG
jgi:hypothetical protein